MVENIIERVSNNPVYAVNLGATVASMWSRYKVTRKISSPLVNPLVGFITGAVVLGAVASLPVLDGGSSAVQDREFTRGS